MLSIRSDVEPVDPSLVQFIVSQYVIIQYCNVALAALLVYDTITTMDKEVKYFWKTHLSFVNVIYFMNRYIGILSAFSSTLEYLFDETEEMCLFSVWTQGLTRVMTILFIDYILLMRVLALYSQDKKLAVCLRIMFSLEAGFGLGHIIYDTLYEEIELGLSKGITVCGHKRLQSPSLSIVSWALLLANGLSLMILALYKARYYWKESAGFSGFYLVKVLVQDQAVYFFMVILCCICNILGMTVVSTDTWLYIILVVLGSPSLLCVLGSRLLVNLKEASERGENGGTSYRQQSISNIEFS